MEKQEISNLSIVNSSRSDLVLGYSENGKKAVLFPAQVTNLSHEVEIMLNKDAYVRSDTIDLSKMGIRIWRKKKRTKLRSSATTTRSKYRKQGWKWTRYQKDLDDTLKKPVPLVKDVGGWYKINLPDYLAFVVKDPESLTVAASIYYTGCHSGISRVRSDRPQIYQAIGLQLIDIDGEPRTGIIPIKHRISAVFEVNSKEIVALAESFSF